LATSNHIDKMFYIVKNDDFEKICDSDRNLYFPCSNSIKVIFIKTVSNYFPRVRVQYPVKRQLFSADATILNTNVEIWQNTIVDQIFEI